jgi:nicotinic acetylcholine receptor
MSFLHIDLIGKYQIYERPVQIENRAVELQFNISLQQIIDLDERNQLLKSNMWLTYHWYDENLVWNEVS